MTIRKNIFLTLLAALSLCISITVLKANPPTTQKKNVMNIRTTAPEKREITSDPDSVDWQQILTPEQFKVLRKAGTDRPFSPVYDEFKGQGKGTYYCAGCGAKLFTSDHKFDSHCGWPSFYDPATLNSVKTIKDTSLGMTRIEVVCANCNGHLGHRFDGEGFDTPTDQRYCINGSVLVFVPDASTSSSD